MTYDEFFSTATGGKQPHPWQFELGGDPECRSRLIRIPTGMGKTLGVMLAWLFHSSGTAWPRRLVWCLPMRTLVEQTQREAIAVLQQTGFAQDIDVHCLMGGLDEADWYAEPERRAVLIGTQDMLLSRALNRGYAMGRAVWPRAFGVINNDALWVMDEVQLMGVGLTTSAQIQAFRDTAALNRTDVACLPRATWWMSATLQPTWLSSPETEPALPDLIAAQLRIRPTDRGGAAWQAQKPVSLIVDAPDQWAATIVEHHEQHEAHSELGRQTLVVVNTVKRAKELYGAIRKLLKPKESTAEVKLIHSRFRPHDRSGWIAEFLSRETLNPQVDRILVATQVVEAGVDISATSLFTELAPWPCLVQRFGRAARYGGRASVFVLDPQPDEKSAAPYSLGEIDAARYALSTVTLQGVSIRDLEDFEEQLSANAPETLAALYPFQPLHVIVRQEFDELFDTSPDLSGADLDVSRFIRGGEEDRDIQVFWRDFDRQELASKPPPADLQPLRDELCRVSVIDARTWLKKISVEVGAAWIWDYVEGEWTRARADQLRPGITLLAAADVGGYDLELGFTGDKRKKTDPPLDIYDEVRSATTGAVTTDADLQDSSDTLSQREAWKTIVTHCHEAASEAQSLADAVGISASIGKLLSLTLRLHDWGKAHPAFASGTYRVDPLRADLAKAPKEAWRAPVKCYDTETHGPRRGFRHELASCLATLELLRQAAPGHSAFQTVDDGMMEALRQFGSLSHDSAPGDVEPNSISDEVKLLSRSEFNLLLYLIASHHGKVRMSVQASPHDQNFPMDNGESFVGDGMPIRGVRDGDVLPAVVLPDSNGRAVQMPDVTLRLDISSLGLSSRYGPAWSERMFELLHELGPFHLGYLEAIVRTADARASRLETADPLLQTFSLRVPAKEPATEEGSSINSGLEAVND
ncbi:MAG: DEAD/DEAH box helicase [Planctomycetales bacterium]|nr:DEAD/DEAH box helicase [Planctomycetales bacterium]